MERKYSTEIAGKIKEFLEGDSWKFFFDSDKGIFHFGLHIGKKLRNIDYIIKVHEDSFTAYAVSPISSDTEDALCMAKMAEYFTRCNCGFPNGNWDMDYDNGEIMYKCFVDAVGMTLSREVIKNSISCIASRFKFCGDGIVDIIYGGVSAKEAAESAAAKLAAYLEAGRVADGEEDEASSEIKTTLFEEED